MNAAVLVLLGFAMPVQSAVDAGTASSSKPAWTERQSWSEPPVRFRVIASELWATPEQAINDVLDQAAPIARDFAAQDDRHVSTAWQVPPRLVQDHLVRDEYLEKVDWDFGPMFRAHVLLELSPEKRDVLLTEWRRFVQQRRLAQLGVGLGFVLLCLATLLAYLRLDDATRGYYTGWLRTAAIAVVAALATALYTLWV